MLRKTESLCVFLTGGVIYSGLELLWRGYTHWSMTAAGGVCLLALHLMHQRLPANRLLLRCTLGCTVITAVEFAVGILVNRVLCWNVWDYSAMPGNLMGQVCPLFSAAWFFLTIPACLLSDGIRRFFDRLEAREHSA